MINFIEYKGQQFLDLQAKGNAARFIRPFAEYFCKGTGYDIGYGEEDWKLPGSIGIDLKNNDGFHAFNLPEQCVDYIHSSHCLEHLTDWVEALQYWISKLKPGGLLFLYLPHKDQTYWLPWNNRKHKHVLDAKLIKSCIESFGMENVVYSDRDLNYSFALIATKKV